MDRLFQQLKDLQDSKPLAKKVLLTHSRRKGGIILKRLALSGVNLTNFFASTVGDLAGLLMEKELVIACIRELDELQKSIIIEEILLSLPKDGYLSNARIEPGLIASVALTLDELRLNDIDLGKTDSSVFTGKNKADELSHVMSQYNERLASGKLADEAALLKMAIIKGEEAASGMITCILPELPLHSLQSLFIEKVLVDKVELLTVKPKGLHGSSQQTEEDSRQDEEYYLADIFAPVDGKTHEDKITISHAVGTVNEVRGALRHIITSSEPIDSYEIACPVNANYLGAILTEAAAQGLPVSSAWGGTPFVLRPVSGLTSLLRWICSNYKDTELYDSINNGDFQYVKDKTKTRTDFHITRALRMSGIGWGRARYRAFIDKDLSSYDNNDEEKETILDLQAFLSMLLDIIPDGMLDDKMTIADLSSLCLGLLGAVVSDDDIYDEAKDYTAAVLDELIIHDRILREPGIAIERLVDILAETGLEGQGPRPGKVYISTLAEPGLSGRKHLMLLGLNEGEFPKTLSHDPILTDDERESLGLPSSKRKLSNALNLGAMSLISHTGDLRISYLSFELTSWQDKAPASLALQAFRLMKGDATASYSDLFESVTQPKSFSPGHDNILLDINDWWLARPRDAAGKEIINKASHMLFNGIKKGEVAYTARKTDKFTAYDGLIDVNKPRGSLIMSASRLESLAECPLRYFFSDVLEATPIDKVLWDPSCWLDPLSRGALFHEAYCLYYREIRNRQYKMDGSRELMLGIIDELTTKYLKKVPCPSKAVYEHELEGLKEDALAFLDNEDKIINGRCPVFFELTFGSKSYGCHDIGIEEKVALDFYKKYPVVLRGSIDRIDQDKNDDYIVIDYKTGSAKRHICEDVTAKGTHLQWALYIIAARAIFKALGKDKHEVVKAEYYFPTRAGKGYRAEIGADKLELAEKVIIDLLDILKQGLFVPHENSFCDYCDWTDVCHTIRSKWDKGPGDNIKSKHEIDESIGRYFVRLRGKCDG